MYFSAKSLPKTAATIRVSLLEDTMPGTPDCTAVPILRKDEPASVAYGCDKDRAARKLYEDAVAATGRISDATKIGSGFFIGDGSRFVTNAHVVNGSTSLLYIEADNGKSYRARIEKLDDLHDLALLRLEDGARHGQALQIGKSIALKKGEPLYALGHPQGSDFTFVSPGSFAKQSSYREAFGPTAQMQGEAQGEIARLSAQSAQTGRDAIEYYDARRVQMELHIEHGSSGGPVLDKHEKVVGVTVNVGPDGTEGHAAWAIPSEYLRNLVDDKSKFDFDYRKVSFMHDHALAGGLSTGIAAAIALKFPRYGAGALAAGELLALPDNVNDLLHGNRDDKIHAGIALGELTTMTAGSVLAFMGRRGLSYAAIATSCALGLASMFQPTDTRLQSIRRVDGSDRLPLLWGE
jgi:S1-C subfamily serine protease